MSCAFDMVEQFVKPAPLPLWQPIDSAPTDGTVVWVYNDAAHGLPGFCCKAAYHPDAGWCCDELREATLWMPIEAAAQIEAKRACASTNPWDLMAEALLAEERRDEP